MKREHAHNARSCDCWPPSTVRFMGAANVPTECKSIKSSIGVAQLSEEWFDRVNDTSRHRLLVVACTVMPCL